MLFLLTSVVELKFGIVNHDYYKLNFFLFFKYLKYFYYFHQVFNHTIKFKRVEIKTIEFVRWYEKNFSLTYKHPRDMT